MTANTVFLRAFRLNTAVLAAAFITFLLFYFMQYLISTDNSNFRPPSITRIIDATMPLIESEVVLEINKPEPVEQLELPELETPIPGTATGNNFTNSLAFETPALPNTGGATIPLSRYMVPLVRATAPYPARALQRGIQGFVELSFTVNAQGRVEDPFVLYAEPEGYFERSALNSISKWQYSPAMEDGVPVPVHDIRQRIVFEIADN